MIKKAFGLLAITAFIMTVSCSKGTGLLDFPEKEFDFGKMNSGDKVEHVFRFTNSGKGDVTITEAHGSCGCTIPDYPKNAIKPGESGEIKVSFNSHGKEGKQHKTVTLNTISNEVKASEILKITADVTPVSGITAPGNIKMIPSPTPTK